ncbi:MAG: organic solvent tolerance protein OstA [Planctomycetota bacterium]|nr:organic solvent tolerance protein OstA [Planctomycetota bacterium]
MEFRHRPTPSLIDGQHIASGRDSHRGSCVVRRILKASRRIFARVMTPMIAIAIACVFVNLPIGQYAAAADIAFPTVEPRLPVRISGKFGSGQRRGSYDVYEILGDCRIEQGDFSVTCERLQIWIEKIEIDEPKSSLETTSNTGKTYANTPEASAYGSGKSTAASRSIYKTIIKCSNGVTVQWNHSDQLKDHEWMGRVYSYSLPQLDVGTWNEVTQELPSLVWEASSAGDSNWVIPTQFQATLSSSPESLPNPQAFQPQAVQSQSLPPTSAEVITPERTGGVQSSMPLGGIVIDGDIPPTLDRSESTTVFQVPTGESIPRTQVPLDSLGNRITPVVSDPPARVGAKTFEFSGRGEIDPQIETIPRSASGQSVVAISRGIRLKFGGASVQTSTGPMDLGTVLIEADRALIWTGDFQRLIANKLDGTPIEVYLEGNVVFQQGQRTIYAERMYYNVQTETGMVLGAEILTPAPQYEGIVRLKADVLEQRSRQSFLAYNAAMTSSRLGVPSYWLQSDRLILQDTRAGTDPSQQAAALRTGQTNMEATARNNFVYVGGVPVLYWPIMNTNIDAPNFYLRAAKIKNDDIFGQQIMLDWDLYNLLGIDGPDGTDWLLSTDYLSERGFAPGTTFRYNVPKTLLPGPATGIIDAWGLSDKGLDTLGQGRFGLVPEEDPRFRVFMQHRQLLTPNLDLTAELGWISDRNFLEQYMEQAWDQNKDQDTNIRLRKYAGNQMLDLVAQARVNPFFTETEQLPRLDYYVLGQSIFDRLTWYSQSQVGYSRLRVLSTPLNPQDLAAFNLMPWEVNAEGIRAGTRQELALPLELGPMKVTPYINGEAMTWGQDVTGQSITRLTGQAGVRSALPFWKVYPEIQNRLFNVNGIAHKASFNTEFFYADSSQNASQFPLYDPLDDNAQEHFRRRMVANTFGGALPDQLDSRAYAIRQGMQRYVTAASKEVVEDQMQFRVGLDQRWQTKRGVPGRERITDLIEFDVEGILFPNPDRDNFGQTVGALNYDARFHVGDRVSLLSDGYADLFDQGLRTLSGGIMLTRPGRGDWYVGLTAIRGPVETLVANTNFNYRLNEKWIIASGSTFDFDEVGNVGNSASITRIGESFLTQVGLNIDVSRSNTSLFFSVEPRFLPLRRLGQLGGMAVPPAGLYGLE